MPDRRSHYYSFEKGYRGFDFHPMKSWFQGSQFSAPTGTHQLEAILNELKLAFTRIGWELLLVMDRIYLNKPGESIGRVVTSIPAEWQPEEGGQPAASDGRSRTLLGFERFMRSELHAHDADKEADLKLPVNSSDRSSETLCLNVTAVDLTGGVAVVEFDVEIATSRHIAHALCYLDDVVKSTGKPAFGIMLTHGFHSRLILATSLAPVIPRDQTAFGFSFEAAV